MAPTAEFLTNLSYKFLIIFEFIIITNNYKNINVII
jgi:hypothetical protein